MALYTSAEIAGLKLLLANTKAVYAVLLDKFHMSPAVLARLTDRQIYEYYLHPRDEHGGIELPLQPCSVAEGTKPTEELSYLQHQVKLESLIGAMHIGEEQAKSLRSDLARKYGCENG